MYKKIRGPGFGQQPCIGKSSVKGSEKLPQELWLGDCIHGACFRSSSDPSRKIRVTLRHKLMNLDLVIPPRYRKKPWRGEENVEKEDVPKGEEEDAPKIKKKDDEKVEKTDDDVDTEDHDEFKATP